MALIERAGNVQREIDQRRYGGLVCVDESIEVHGKSLLPIPPQKSKLDVDMSKGLEHGEKVANSDSRNGNGVITVSTTDHSDAPLSHVDLYLQRPQFRVQNDQVNRNTHPLRLEQAPAPASQGNVFTQLTGKIYSIMDVACNDSFFSSPVKNLTAEGWRNSGPGMESYSLGTMSGLTDVQVNSKLPNATDQLPHIHHTQKDQMSNQASSDVWSGLPNRATNQLDGEQSTVTRNPSLTLQPLNQWHQNQINLKPSIASRPINRVNRDVIEDGGDDKVRVIKGGAADHGQARAVEKENRSSKSKKHQIAFPVMTSSLMKLKSNILTKFGTKAAIKGSNSGGGGGGGMISAPKKLDGSCPTKTEPSGRLLQLSNGTSGLFET
jgi:hypothetical protein